jgi:hypothetical protein
MVVFLGEKKKQLMFFEKMVLLWGWINTFVSKKSIFQRNTTMFPNYVLGEHNTLSRMICPFQHDNHPKQTLR